MGKKRRRVIRYKPGQPSPVDRPDIPGDIEQRAYRTLVENDYPEDEQDEDSLLIWQLQWRLVEAGVMDEEEHFIRRYCILSAARWRGYL